jgi:hypothetical protein
MADAIIIQAMSLGGDGLRVAVKDSLDIAGYPTRGGSAALADAPPAARHADVVQAVLDAGCRIIGKANMHELAYGVTGVNRWTGTPANPLHPGHIPGGSSSGSAAAVAAGLCDFALGTDTGGSIRTPAACCGVFGLKPTFGRVSRQGAWPAPLTRRLRRRSMRRSLAPPHISRKERCRAWTRRLPPISPSSARRPGRRSVRLRHRQTWVRTCASACSTPAR